MLAVVVFLVVDGFALGLPARTFLAAGFLAVVVEALGFAAISDFLGAAALVAVLVAVLGLAAEDLAVEALALGLAAAALGFEVGLVAAGLF